MVRVEDLTLVQAERFDNILVGVGVDRLLERLTQQILAAFGRGDMAIGAQHDVVGGERVGGDEEAEVALDDTTFVFGQPVRVLPQRDVARHIHFLGHPVVRAAGQVFLPGPLIFERNQLIDVRLPIDDALVGDVDARFGGGRRALSGRNRSGCDRDVVRKHGLCQRQVRRIVLRMRRCRHRRSIGCSHRFTRCMTLRFSRRYCGSRLVIPAKHNFSPSFQIGLYHLFT